jgi:hypothetical protein
MKVKPPGRKVGRYTPATLTMKSASALGALLVGAKLKF